MIWINKRERAESWFSVLDSNPFSIHPSPRLSSRDSIICQRFRPEIIGKICSGLHLVIHTWRIPPNKSTTIPAEDIPLAIVLYSCSWHSFLPLGLCDWFLWIRAPNTNLATLSTFCNASIRESIHNAQNRPCSRAYHSFRRTAYVHSIHIQTGQGIKSLPLYLFPDDFHSLCRDTVGMFSCIGSRFLFADASEVSIYSWIWLAQYPNQENLETNAGSS